MRAFYHTYEKVQQAVGQLDDLPIARILKLMEKLPKKLKSSLPTIEDIELELLTYKKKAQSTTRKRNVQPSKR